MQLAEVQFVHWASIRPDPVPLALGVNQVVGPNGAGKTAFLDGIKLLYGIDDFGGEHKLRSYVFDGGPQLPDRDPPVPADMAYVRGTFRNPRRGQAHRVFAAFGSGCEHADFVTVICMIRRVGSPARSYLVVPGWERIGVDRSIEADLRRWAEQPQRRWIGSDTYYQRLEAIGISRTHRRILALPQGETAEVLRDPPDRLFNRVLELTGKQAVLDEFRGAHEAYEKANARYQHVQQQLVLAEARLERLELRVQRHKDFRRAEQELEQLREVLLPAGRYKELVDKATGEGRALDGVRERLVEVSAKRARLAAHAPILAARIRRLAARVAKVTEQVTGAEGNARTATLELGGLQQEQRRLNEQLQQAERLAGEQPLAAWEQQVADARAAHAAAEETFGQAADTVAQLREEAEPLRAGRPVPPPDLVAFTARLRSRGIHGMVVAEALDIPDAAGEPTRRLAETALGEGLWTIAVDPTRFDEAVTLAVDAGYRLPLARSGPGRPTGVLAGLVGSDRLGTVLEAFDADPPGGVPVDGARQQVTVAGVRRSRVVAQFTLPERPVLGHQARAARLAEIERTLAVLEPDLRRLEHEVEQAAGRIAVAESGHEAAAALPGLREAQDEVGEQIAQLEPVEAALRARHRALTNWHAQLGKRLEVHKERADKERQEHDELAPLELQLTRQVEVAEQTLSTLQAQLAKAEEGLSSAQRKALAAGVEPVEALQSREQRLRDELADRTRYPDDVRDMLVVAQCEEERIGLEDARRLLDEEYRADVEKQRDLVDKARTSYNTNVVSTIGLLNDRFRELCEQAGMEGLLRRIELDGRPDVEGLDVLVSHRPGERPRSYRETVHSGGQRVKMAILLLLATLQISGAADFLILDEPTAHLDETNIRMVGQLMRSLAGHVQFLLATPTSGEERHLAAWSDLIIGFAPRATGELYSPPVQLLLSERAVLDTPPGLPFEPTHLLST